MARDHRARLHRGADPAVVYAWAARSTIQATSGDFRLGQLRADASS